MAAQPWMDGKTIIKPHFLVHLHFGSELFNGHDQTDVGAKKPIWKEKLMLPLGLVVAETIVSAFFLNGLRFHLALWAIALYL